MGKPKAPKAPDPKDTSAAATGTSVGTAIANTMMGNVNQVGPDGSLTYDQTGTYDWTDPYTNKTYTLPTFTATTAMSDANKAIYDTNTATQGNLADMGRDQSAFLKEYLSRNQEGLQPDEALRSRYEDALMERMRPRLEADRNSMETRLANQGINVGSRAYNAAQGNYDTAVNDARLGAIGAAGNEQARDFQVRAAARNQPINEIMALLSGSQVTMPSFGMNQPSQIATTDNAGIINQNYQNKMQAYNAQMNQWNGTMGGLFGLGAAAISDRRLKADIRRIGQRSGLNLYEYRYLWDTPGTVRRGFMAQEVAKVIPDAVLRFGKWLALDYAKLPEVS
jgi:hypothetical protein